MNSFIQQVCIKFLPYAVGRSVNKADKSLVFTEVMFSWKKAISKHHIKSELYNDLKGDQCPGRGLEGPQDRIWITILNRLVQVGLTEDWLLSKELEEMKVSGRWLF